MVGTGPDDVAEKHEAGQMALLAELETTPDQRMALDGLFARKGGQLAHFEASIGGQGTRRVLNIAVLAWTFLRGERVMWSTEHYAEARSAFQGFAEILHGNPFLDRHVKSYRATQGGEEIELDSGARVVFRCRFSQLRGFAVDKLIVEQEQALHSNDRMWLLPLVAGRPDPQVVYVS
jgi:hypothetical protein